MIGRKRPGVRVAPSRPSVTPGPETSLWYWHPFRSSVRFGPADFRAKLKAIDSGLDVTWSPVHQQWCIWMRKPRIQQALCWGWALLFSVPPTMLDERVFARLFAASTDQWGSAKNYFRAVQRELEREREQREAATTQDSIDRAMPYFEHSQIKVSGFGKSSGSKFSDYHS